MCGDLGTTSRICAMYSFTGILFTLFVGVLLQTQPMFITGLDDTEDAKENAFGAMGMFLATFGLSIFGIMRAKDDREELESTVDMGYQLSGNVGEFPSSRY